MAFCNLNCACGSSCVRQDDHGGDCDCHDENCSKSKMNVLEGANINHAVVIGNGFRGKIDSGEIVLCPSREASDRDDVLRLKDDGRIFVHGRLAETDQEVVDSLRRCLASWGLGVQTREQINLGIVQYIMES